MRIRAFLFYIPIQVANISVIHNQARLRQNIHENIFTTLFTKGDAIGKSAIESSLPEGHALVHMVARGDISDIKRHQGHEEGWWNVRGTRHVVDFRAGRSTRRITRGAPWGSPRQANPTNNRPRARSRPADWARSRWGSADRNAAPRCSTRLSPASRSRSSSSTGRRPLRAGDDDDSVADEGPRARTIADNTCGISGIG
jgi:hypothetical protein